MSDQARKEHLRQKMIIPIDEKTRIRGTETCWQLEKTRTVKGETEWRPFKYFTTFGEALHAAAQREIRTFPSNGIAEAIAACNRVTQKYAQIFDSVGKNPKDVK